MITLKFIENPAMANTPAEEVQIWASEQFPAITVKSISAAWNLVRKYRDEAAEVVENEILEVTFEGGLPHSDRIPKHILFKKNTKGKLEFRDADKEEAKKLKAEDKKMIEEEAVTTVNEVLEEETKQD